MQPLVVPSDLDSLSIVGKYVLDAAAEAGLDNKAAYRLRLAVDEVVTNIIIYGYQEAQIEGHVNIHAEIHEQTLTITVEDTARPFDPRKHSAPDDFDLPLEERDEGGLGVFLALNGVDEFVYEYVHNQNRNIFVMNRS